MREVDGPGAVTAAGVLFHDAGGRVLLVEPTYKPGWEIPGGMVDGVETPRAACVREVREELGLTIEPGPLLVVDWAPKDGVPHVRFVFDGGTPTAAELAAITFTDGELRSWAWVTPDEVPARTVPRLARRIAAALGALAEGGVRYCENGRHP
ncbi:NUDIX domain-containing protein [Pseudonocardia sp. CA-107938]|uniref:NUDIX domain-containing protein n=1 Tax=Pseudonocardia sp. CA-107938 TaxID=3240021 RepID=UPI003D8B7428